MAVQQEMQESFARVLGYDGPMQGFNSFIQSDPAASEKYKGMLAIAEKQREMAKQNMMKRTQAPKPQMAQGGYMMDRFAQNQQQDTVGGYVPPPTQSFNVGGLTTLPTAKPPSQDFQDVTRPVTDTNPYLADGTTPNPNFGKDTGQTTTSAPNIGEMGAQMITTPGLPTGGAVEAVGVDAGTNQFLQTSTGGVTPNAVAVPTTLASTATAQGQTATSANQIDPAKAETSVNTALQQTQAAQGVVGANAQVTAQQQVASSVAELNAAQGIATQMTNPVQRQVQAGELVSPVANAETASTYAEQIQAATATPTEKATVQGQLATLTANFDASNPPV